MRFRRKLYAMFLGMAMVVILLTTLIQIRTIEDMGNKIEESVAPTLGEHAQRIALLESQKYAVMIDEQLRPLIVVTESYAGSIGSLYVKDEVYPGYSSTPAFSASVFNRLSELKNSNKDLINVYYSDSRGKLIIIPRAELPEGYNATKSPWYQKAVREGPSWIEPYTDIITNKTVITYITPVKYGGVVKGVLGIDVDFSLLSQEIMNTKIGKTGYLFVISPNGTVVIHPNQDLVGKLNIFNDRRYEALARAMKNSEEGVVELNLDGKKMVVSFAKSKTTGWTVAAVAPEDELVGGLISALDNAKHAASREVLYGTVVMVTLAAGLVLLSVRYLKKALQPVEQLRNAAELIAAGRLKEARDAVGAIDYPHRDDEIGKLITAFESISSDVIGTLNEVIEKLEAMAEGRLDYSVDTRARGDLQNIIVALQGTSAKMRALIGNIRRIGMELDEQADELAGIAVHVKNSTDQVSEAIEQVSIEAQRQQEHINSITEGMRLVSDVTTETSRVMEEFEGAIDEVVRIAQEGRKKGDEAVRDVESIKRSMAFIEEAVNAVSEMSKRIGEITHAISNIAEQTNLLALNAAIEAARAGEAGRGFAVVAQEIRGLAEESKNAAETIRDIIEEMDEKVRRAVEETQRGVNNVASSTETLSESLGYLGYIAEMVQEVGEKVAAIKEQTERTHEEVSRALQALEGLAASAEETTASAEEVNSAMQEQRAEIEALSAGAAKLREIARELRENVEQFRL
ncbi:methyl-accepting chemotaxis protein [Thermococcus sp. 21S7]|uniref:methyl-accepting chemotaxis protein n=1 Tax=Thermococcus sp. 21S7 TaxID=1638221 RepID=UPI00143BE09D|nr:methyl-accepting chemotaxis protein [Thermococcus sp. 21S7]